MSFASQDPYAFSRSRLALARREDRSSSEANPELISSFFAHTLDNDLERIREKLSRMAAAGEQALNKALEALLRRNRQLAYTAILGDRRVDEMERELDQLCLAFLVRQQPVGGPLRFVYSTIRINLELERVGDYAESIARQTLRVLPFSPEFSHKRFQDIAGLAIPMLRDAVRAFVTQDVALANRTSRVEEEVENLRTAINAELLDLRQRERIPLEVLTPLMTIARRFERVADQAKNICQEALYAVTGEYARHKEDAVFRILFVSEFDACRAPMAAAIGNRLNRRDLLCESAGFHPGQLDPRTISFLSSKGLSLSGHTARGLAQIRDLERYHLVVGLVAGVPHMVQLPARTVFLDWTAPDPSAMKGDEKLVQAAYEYVYREIREHISDLTEAILGDLPA